MASTSKTATRRVYLDHAATSWPKCEQAITAAFEYVRQCGATTGRGAYASARVADRWLEQARHNLAQLIGARRGGELAICTSGTHALNAALHGVLRPGDHVITTAMEHNSLLRPLKQLQLAGVIDFDVVGADEFGRSHAAQAEPLVRENTKLLAVGHACNVTGTVNELAGWRDLARHRGCRLLVDASQTLGHLPIDVVPLGIDILASAGHKGLRALPGTGMLYVQSELHAGFRPLILGGTGRASETIDQLPEWPLAVEVGNLNMPGVVSMAVAAQQLIGRDDLESDWRPAFERLMRGLWQLPKVHMLGGPYSSTATRIPVVSIRVEGWSVHDLAAVLDESFQIEVRAGLHCAALVHHDIGTMSDGGTLRLSTGCTTTFDEVDCALQALGELTS